MKEVDAWDIAQKIVDDWEDKEEESMRDGHAFTLKHLIVDALLEVIKEERKNGGYIY